MKIIADKRFNSTGNMLINYSVQQLQAYINWIYFFHVWGFQPKFAEIAHLHGCDSCRAMWLAHFPEKDRAKASEAMQLFKETSRLLNEIQQHFSIKAIFRLLQANSEGDDIHIAGLRIPFLRQQQKQKESQPNLCLSDFIRPLSHQKTDTIGVFATAVTCTVENIYAEDPYKSLLIQTLSSRLAEAAAEKMHEYVRKEAWGYAPNEQLSIPDLLAEKYQGIRPAVGYPSIPDQSINFLLDKLLDFNQIGITITENGAMKPHASVSGFMFAHPASRYFHIGKIGHDQLNDYALRRQMSVKRIKQFLTSNL